MRPGKFSMGSLLAAGLLFSFGALAQEAQPVTASQITRAPRLDGMLVKIGGESGAKAARPAGPAAWGTSATSYYRESPYEFSSSSSAQGWDDDGNISIAFHRYTTGTFYGLIGTSPHLPGGSLLTYLELDYCDTNATSDVTLNLWACDYDGTNCGLSPIATLSSATTAGCGSINMDLSSLGYVNDNYLKEIIPVVFTGAGDSTTSLAGVIFGYQLQVSPAPVTPTFADVPTGGFGYQYIEALSASGITGGCGGGNYCPNGNVTRAQMAVFIAKALGLAWNGY